MSSRLVYALSLSLALAAGHIALGQNPPPRSAARPEAPPADSAAPADSDAELAPFRAAADEISRHFAAGQAERVASYFLPDGELIDDEGNAHQGQEEIQSLLAQYFKKYPGAQLTIQMESLRLFGPVAIEEGTRLLATKEAGDAEVRYITVWARTGDGWKIASTRELPEDSLPTPHEQLQPLAWLVGEWVNEGSDAVVSINYRWSDDGNFLLGDFSVTSAGEVTMKSHQRIGWNPVTGKVRSWLFDSDGGFAEGDWTYLDGAWVIKSSATLPDGQTGSATITLRPEDQDRYSIEGTDRIVGTERNDDFAVTVTRKAPPPAGR